MRRARYILCSIAVLSFILITSLPPHTVNGFHGRTFKSPESRELSLKDDHLVSEARAVAYANVPYAAVINFCLGGRYGLLSQWAFMNHKDYSQTQKYDYFQGDSLRAPHGHFFTPPAWGKAAFLWQLLEKKTEHRWFLLADCDALYMKLDESVEQLLGHLGYEHGAQGTINVVVARDLGDSTFNTGFMLVRNEDWSLNFFADVLRLSRLPAVREHPWWEQHAMHTLYKENKHNEQIHIGIVGDRSRLNAFTVVRSEYRDGYSFVRHQVNCPGHPENNATTFEQCAENFAIFFCSRFRSRHVEECSTQSSRERS